MCETYRLTLSPLGFFTVISSTEVIKWEIVHSVERVNGSNYKEYGYLHGYAENII